MLKNAQMTLGKYGKSDYWQVRRYLVENPESVILQEFHISSW